LAPALTAAAAPDLAGLDGSTSELVRRYRTLRGRHS